MFWNAFLTLDNQRVHQLLVQSVWKFCSVIKDKFLDFHQGVGDFLCNVRDSLHRLLRGSYNAKSHKCDVAIPTTNINDLCHDIHSRHIPLCNRLHPLLVCLKSHLCNTSIGDLHLRCLPTSSVATPIVVTHFAALGATRVHRFFVFVRLALFGFVVHCHTNFFPIQIF